LPDTLCGQAQGIAYPFEVLVGRSPEDDFPVTMWEAFNRHDDLPQKLGALRLNVYRDGVRIGECVFIGQPLGAGNIIGQAHCRHHGATPEAVEHPKPRMSTKTPAGRVP